MSLPEWVREEVLAFQADNDNVAYGSMWTELLEGFAAGVARRVLKEACARVTAGAASYRDAEGEALCTLGRRLDQKSLEAFSTARGVGRGYRQALSLLASQAARYTQESTDD